MRAMPAQFLLGFRVVGEAAHPSSPAHTIERSIRTVIETTFAQACLAGICRDEPVHLTGCPGEA